MIPFHVKTTKQRNRGTAGKMGSGGKEKKIDSKKEDKAL